MRKRSPARRNPALTFGLVAALLLGGAWLLLQLNTEQQRAATIGGPFSLVDGAGRRVTQADLRGRFALIYFGYTECPDICPTTLEQMADAVNRLGRAGGHVQPVFITVDPAHDTPAVMARYTAAISPRLLGLTGNAEEVARAERAFHIKAVPTAEGGMDHSAVIYLMGPNGSLLVPIPSDTHSPAIAAEIARYLS